MTQQDINGLHNRQTRQIISTPSPAAKKTFFYVQEAGYLAANDFGVIDHSDLDSYLIVAVISGTAILTVNGESYTLAKGDCFFIDCHTRHSYRSSDIDPCELMWINFNGATSQQYYEYFLTQSRNIFRPPFFEKVISAMNEIIEINGQKATNAEIQTSKRIMDLLTLALTVQTDEEQYDSALKQKLAAVNRYIEDHFSEDLSLEQLSTEFYISKFYLTREYKKIYGKTIFQHIITARINYGKQLLRFSDKSVDEIAHLCGFNDQSYFARQFKKSENLTCFAYRKKWRE